MKRLLTIIVLLWCSTVYAQPALRPGGNAQGLISGTGTPNVITKWQNSTTITNGTLTDTATQQNQSVCFADGTPPYPVLNCGDPNIKYNKGTATLNLVNGAFQVNGAPIAGFTQLTIGNDGTTGTSLNKLVKLTGAPSKAIVTAISDTVGAIGICSGGCGTTGTATVTMIGAASCVFDGATTASHFVQISSSVAGECHDAGATYPGTGEVLGKVLSTNGSGGTYSVVIGSPDTSSTNSGGTITGTGTNGTLTQWTGTSSIGTMTGTNGGIPYFGAANAVSSSAALTAHGVVIGGGAGGAPTSTGAGTTGQPLLSNGASSDPTYGTLGVGAGGTGLTSGTSGGILGFTAAGTLASSGALTANILVKGGGAGATPTNSSITDNGTTVSTSEALSVGAFTYGGTLKITDKHSDSSNYNIAHRVHACTGGSGSSITGTLPAATGSLIVYDVVKVDSGTAACVIGVTGGDVIDNGATTRTLTFKGDIDTCYDIQSGLWICSGSGT